MDVILETKEQIEPEFKAFTENRVKFSLKRLFWLVRKIKVKYSSVTQAKTACNQNCIIELQTFDNRQIEVSFTARDRRTALEMGLKRSTSICKKRFIKPRNTGVYQDKCMFKLEIF